MSLVVANEKDSKLWVFESVFMAELLPRCCFSSIISFERRRLEGRALEGESPVLLKVLVPIELQL